MAVGAQESPNKDSQPPELTLESLYHPKKKFDFDGELPEIHWVDDAPSKLLIRREDLWHQVDLGTGEIEPWPLLDQLVDQIETLDGIDREKASEVAVDSVSEIESSANPVLVRIDQSLAIAGIESPAKWLTRDASSWRNAKLDPSGRRVAYTQHGDLFLQEVESSRTLQLTNDQSETLLDGVLDWTYQEEIFGRGNFRGFWFGPDGNWLAMLRIDISGIKPYTLGSSQDDRGLGGVSRYPKAGDPIPQAKLLLWDLRHVDSGEVPAPRTIVESSPDTELIVTGVWWHPDTKRLLFCISDRVQTWRELRGLAPDQLNQIGQPSQLILREESPAWVEPPTAPLWLADGSLIWRSALPTGRVRLFHVSAGGKAVTPISPPDFDVTEAVVNPDGFVVLAGDHKTGFPQQQVYRIDGINEPAELKLLTHTRGVHEPDFSPDGKWFADRHSTPGTPPTLTLHSTDSSKRKVSVLASPKLTTEVRAPEMISISAKDGTQLNAMLIRPTSREPSPVLVEVYGGPQSPVVTGRWSGTKTLYRELLARRGIATLVVDNRSSGGLIPDTWKIRHRMGRIEVDDMKSVAEWLRDQEWVQPDRMAIRGWSFGGYMTLNTMTQTDAFVAGIAGGSVTDWREYDAFYTERYMGLPSKNETGYDETSLVSRAGDLRGEVLLIHGELDDNVHPSGTLRMALALQEAGKDFRLMIYPKAAHAVRAPGQMWHLARMTDRFLIEKLLDHAGDSE